MTHRFHQTPHTKGPNTMNDAYSAAERRWLTEPDTDEQDEADE